MNTRYKCRCNDCEREFRKENLDEIHTTYESFYGVSELFETSKPLTLLVCPYCQSDDWEEIYVGYDDEDDDEDDDEYENYYDYYDNYCDEEER